MKQTFSGPRQLDRVHNCNRLRQRFLATFLLSVLAASNSMAQSFNIDLEIGVGGPEVGAGTPDSGFAGAAGVSGFWNGVRANGPAIPAVLFDIHGQTTSATVWVTGGFGSAGGFNNSSVSGDYRLLMSDFADIGLPVTYHFAGLLPGSYRIYTYAVDPASQITRDVLVTLPTAEEADMHVNGILNGNVFTQGITHSIHDLDLSGSNFELTVSGPEHHTRCNGFQIVSVPEPLPVIAL